MSGKIGFIGAGNMAEALVRGLLDASVYKASHIQVSDPDATRREYFRAAFGVAGTALNQDVAQWADILVLAVKPQVMKNTLSDIRGSVTSKQLIISIAAGLPTTFFEAELPKEAPVVRVMPNMGASVGLGAAALCGGMFARSEHLDMTERIMCASGLVVRVNEDQMDAVTALSGSGPAYLFYFMEAMEEAAARMGLSHDVARILVQATVEGAGRVVRVSGLDPAEWRAKVTSKGGTTAAAIAALDKQNARQLIGEAIQAAHARARELAGG
jgi:pyrroline-5-carboxylate reductase